MRRLVWALLSLALLAGCGESPVEKSRDDDRDIAMVERMNQTPFRPILPQPITRADIVRFDLGRAGCSFRPGTDPAADPLFVTQDDRGYLKVEGKLRPVAAKAGSAELPAGARSTYVGLDSWIELAAQAGPGGTEGPAGSSWPSRFVIHDAQERIAFEARGMVRCTP
ncbi:hypothetical protein [Novosphingobium album (ex Liu et al. 2023)]|uniref:Lipoprotein n=1 Tax=Novosphingobium album (ex Liu et al. 2023) TaxID=3031130 RepID=A0ABT5WTW6_9SPHN|nr:hypothetical protein [Novosphingobium album (ex Liu et al. 2023)]MDE8653341.1 hypothetical protein [Novosphingobium album (ex Liu et al. 2023)]